MDNRNDLKLSKGTYSFYICKNSLSVFKAGGAVFKGGSLRFEEFPDEPADPTGSTIDKKHLKSG